MIANKKLYIIFYILLILLGFIYINVINKDYESKYEFISKNNDIKLKVIVLSDANVKEYKSIYEIEIIEIENIGNELNYEVEEVEKSIQSYKGSHWLLNVKNSIKVEGKNSLDKQIEYGDLIEITGEFEIPSEARNYKGFDYKKYLKTQKIYGNIKATDNIYIIEKNAENLMQKILYLVSSDIKNKIYKILPEETKELCVGILIGQRKNISDEITETFKNSSLTHMLAISGAHLSYIILGLSILLSRIGKKKAKIITIIFLLFFTGITNFTPSVERASIMSILILIANLIHRKSDVYNNLALSALIILLINPYSLLNMGFQLSYGGTIGILIFYKKISNFIYSRLEQNKKEILPDTITMCKKIKQKCIKKLCNYIMNALILTFSANLMIVPIMAINFNTISFTFWISNLLAGPFIGIIIILGFITYFVSIIFLPFAKLIGIPLNIVLQILINISKICSNIPLSNVKVKTPYIHEIFVYYIFLYILTSKKYLNLLKLVLKVKHNKIITIIIVFIVLCCFIFNSFSISIFNSLKIYFVDVGQGDCTLIITPTNKTILIDGGGSEKGTFDVGEKTLFPYLLNRRVTQIDYMLISHFDSDHIGGLFYILENLKVRNIIISKQAKTSENYEKLKGILKEKKINVIIAIKGEIIQIDKYVHFEIIFPQKQQISNNALNNNSIVAKMQYKDFSILFTGDIEKIAEDEIIKEYKGTNKLNANILKIAHHGSKTSSSKSFLEAVKPKLALIGVGANNNFGHPSNITLESLNAIGCKIYRTDENGEISIRVNSKGKIWIDKMLN